MKAGERRPPPTPTTSAARAPAPARTTPEPVDPTSPPGPPFLSSYLLFHWPGLRWLCTTVFTSRGHCNDVDGLNDRDRASHAVQESGSSKPKSQQGWFLQEAPGRVCSQPLFPLLVAVDSLQCPSACGHIIPVSTSRSRGLPSVRLYGPPFLS